MRDAAFAAGAPEGVIGWIAAAADAVTAAAQRAGGLISVHVILRPHAETETILPGVKEA